MGKKKLLPTLGLYCHYQNVMILRKMTYIWCHIIIFFSNYTKKINYMSLYVIFATKNTF
jgi:hypothetical protein